MANTAPEIKEVKQQKELFETSDFYLAVYLKAAGSRLLEARPVAKSNKVIFSFEFDGQDTKTKNFYNGQDPETKGFLLKFISGIRELKGIVRVI